MTDINKLIEFQNTSFSNETKDTNIRVKMSTIQKEALKMMSIVRKTTISKLIWRILLA
ncbi:hypothetical protein [Paramaledivibacter caminithermalis]|jgi:hypothetical protein|uniref:Uncharacterized protein n=1 Tax=Paramaledivibacter caminithermalis (strain DSM 15212 / CIP 107654 / DViRD3) TaxID=1121301 RepID=A0A1M6KJ66_PARC5|nr:hypothetical protein [Paramaledivibacter caminithermalis]SHJ58996.1 hypothetical protein SAMN02745912_00427 [Paramaledivibacter caminithermalis DSM 15212]